MKHKQNGGIKVDGAGKKYIGRVELEKDGDQSVEASRSVKLERPHLIGGGRG